MTAAAAVGPGATGPGPHTQPWGHGLGRRMVVSLAVALSLVAVLALVADRLLRPGTYRIEHVRVEGDLSRVALSDVEAAVSNAITGNFFSVDLGDVERAVEGVYWVDEVEVKRRWPNTLAVELSEVRPVGRWNDERWVTDAGKLIRLPADDALAALPEMHGPDESAKWVLERFRHWSPVFRSVGLTLRSIEINSRDSWRVVVSRDVYPEAGGAPPATHEVEIQIGHVDPDDRVAQFAQLFARSLTGEFYRMRTVDLRYPNGFAVGWVKPATAGES